MTKIINVIDKEPIEISLSQARHTILIHENESYTYFDEGSTRYVYRNKDLSKVLKVCKVIDDNYFNKEEFDIYVKTIDKSKLAKTKLLSTGLIEQEFCTPLQYSIKELTDEQKEFANMCRLEVGWNSENKLLCYDLSEYLKYDNNGN